MNGALNNASMAFELALGETARTDESSRTMLRTGLASIARASRAAALLAHLVQGRGAPDDPEGAYAQDVRELLLEHARSSGGTPAPEIETRALACKGAAEACELLVVELARMRR